VQHCDGYRFVLCLAWIAQLGIGGRLHRLVGVSSDYPGMLGLLLLVRHQARRQKALA
jgi:hypothetical protein